MAQATHNLSRRIVLATIAGIIPAAAIASPALALPTEPDPILAAIERHKVTFRISQEMGRIRFYMTDLKWAPGYDADKLKAADEADSSAQEAADDAANALIMVRPTTMAGVLALIHHVEAFNAGAFFLEPYPDIAVSNWQSAPMFWPTLVDDDEIDQWGYAILANVRGALEAMVAVS